MSIIFLEGFKLAVNEHHDSEDMLEDGLNSIGCITSLAASCSNVVAAVNSGSKPTDSMVEQLSYASTVLSGIAQDLSNLLTTLDVEK